MWTFVGSKAACVINFTALSVSVTNGTLTTTITNVGNDYSFGITPAANVYVTVSISVN